MVCSQCGKDMPNSSEHCGFCGARIVPTVTLLDDSPVVKPAVQPPNPYTGNVERNRNSSSGESATIHPIITHKAKEGKRYPIFITGITMIIVTAVSFLLSTIRNVFSIQAYTSQTSLALPSITEVSTVLNILSLITFIAAAVFMFREARRTNGSGKKGMWTVLRGLGDVSQILVILFGFLGLFITLNLFGLVEKYSTNPSDTIYLTTWINILTLVVSALVGVFYIVSGVIGKRFKGAGSLLITAGVFIILGDLTFVLFQLIFTNPYDISHYFIITIISGTLMCVAMVLRGVSLIKLAGTK